MGEVIEFKPRQHEKRPESLVRDIFDVLEKFLEDNQKKEVFLAGHGLVLLEKISNKNQENFLKITFEDGFVMILNKSMLKSGHNGLENVDLQNSQERERLNSIVEQIVSSNQSR